MRDWGAGVAQVKKFERINFKLRFVLEFVIWFAPLDFVTHRISTPNEKLSELIYSSAVFLELRSGFFLSIFDFVFSFA